jgi:ribosomal protein S15P/S13E
MGQQSNKVQKRRRRLDYLKRKKVKSKTSAATTKA